MSSTFNGRTEFARAEGQPTARLLGDLRRGLAELEKRSRGAGRDKVRATRSRIDPGLDALLRAGEAVRLDPEPMRRMRRLFELWHREDAQAAGVLRETVEA